MSTTWATRLQADEGHDLRLYFTIQGIKNVFQEDEEDVPAALEAVARTRTKLVTSISQGETRLNLATRRVEGGSLTIRLTDDDSGTLRTLFASVRQRRQTFIVPNIGNYETAADTTINVNSTTRLAASGDVYVGAETITYTGKTATTLTGCTRGAYDSEAQKHYGGTADGAPVFNTVPTWIGRRVYLTGYFLQTDGTTTSDLSQALGTFRIESQPRHLGDDQWELQCSELSDEFASKKIGGGIETVDLPSTSRAATDPTDSTLGLVEVGAGRNYDQFVVGTVDTHVMLTSDDDQVGVYTLVSQVNDASDDTIQVDLTEVLVDPTPDFYGHYLKTARHIALLRGSPSTIALRVLTSRLGDATNGSSDDLPGRDRDELGGGQWRMGAGISASEVDTSSFTSIGSGAQWFYIIDDEQPVEEFMREFCLATDSAWLVSRAGQLTAIQLSEDGAASVLTIDDDMIVDDAPVRVEHDESAIVPRVRLRCNYDPITQDYLATVNLFDSEIQAAYPGREDRIEINSKSIFVSDIPSAAGRLTIARPPIARAELETKLRRIQSTDKRGRGLVHMVCHLPVLAAEVGDVVTLTVTAPDLEGGSSLSAQLCRVVSMRPRYDDAEVDVTVQIIDTLYRIAPACTVASVAGDVLTLTTTGPETADATPGRMFADNWPVQLWDVSAGTVSQHVILSHTDTTITLDTTPPVGFGATAGEDFIRIDVAGFLQGEVSDNGYEWTDFLYQMPDDEYVAESYGAPITRWR